VDLPHDSAEQVAHIYTVHQDRIRAGCIFHLVGFGMIGAWGVSVAAQTRRKEGLFPVLTYAQLVTMAAAAHCSWRRACCGPWRPSVPARSPRRSP